MPRQVGSKRTRERRSREQWAQLLTGHRDSALSVGRYCEREGISEASFYRWRKLLGGEIAPASFALAPVVKGAHRPKMRAAQFLDLGMMNAAPMMGGSHATRPHRDALEVRLEFGAGVVLTLTRG